MLGRRSKNSAAAIRATTTHARLEALELTLLAVLPLLPPASRAIVRSNIAGFMDEDITTPPASLVPTRHAQLFRDTLRGQSNRPSRLTVGPGRNCRNDRPRTRRAEEIASRRELSVLLLVTHDLTNRHERIKHAECFMVHGAKNQRCNNLSE